MCGAILILVIELLAKSLRIQPYTKFCQNKYYLNQDFIFMILFVYLIEKIFLRLLWCIQFLHIYSVRYLISLACLAILVAICTKLLHLQKKEQLSYIRMTSTRCKDWCKNCKNTFTEKTTTKNMKTMQNFLTTSGNEIRKIQHSIWLGK